MRTAKLSNLAKNKLDSLLREAVACQDVPAVVGMVSNSSEVLYCGAVDAPADGIFRLASMTKPVTSVSIMLLKERGLLCLDDPVKAYLPEYADRKVLRGFSPGDSTFDARPADGPITIRHLLTHTSGFGYGFCNETLKALCQVTDKEPLDLPILHDPGARWTYGLSVDILGDVVSHVAQEPFHVFQETQILQPLGMSDTRYIPKSQDRERFIPLYNRRDTSYELDSQPLPSAPRLTAGGGLIGTAQDYIRFLQMFLNKGILGDVRLLSEQSVDEMTRNQIGNIVVDTQPGAIRELCKSFPIGAGKDKFGLGFQIRSYNADGCRSLGSCSWGGLLNTHFWFDPQEDIAVVLFTQMLPFYDERCMRLLRDVEKCIYEDLV